MKTRNYLKTVALIIAVIFTVVTANATEKVTKASSHENIVETSLNIENWMTNEAIWNTSDVCNFVEAQEETLNLENWMTNSDVWSTSTDWAVETTEANLELEGWMTNDFDWKVEPTATVETETEGNLSLEDWMINERVWNM
ncbi:hypothetical protein [Draconibacterium halophilum]|uniref:Uncharacterized protein n=1 Tax=Draconibacterium halophilum TaxID=2706887 RepID=A0A6C0RDQ7_9BACT|nr:hypothetical protein [Draconibacterium halophilum]QIA07281.1 hypothetical protein G0Q07_05885 [Draconibacterium halophilum]